VVHAQVQHWFRQQSPSREIILETFYEAKPGLLKKSAIALGFFDGVHPGHKVVISKAVEEAKRLGATPAVVTIQGF
jgi:FAD synthase